MKRIILGLVSFGMLCVLAYYSGYLYTDSWYQGMSLEERLKGIAEPAVPEETTEHTEESTEGEDLTEAKSRESQESEQTRTVREAEEVTRTGTNAGALQAHFPGASTEEPEYQYYLIEEFGYVNIYQKDMETLYEQTEISIGDLPQELQDEICTGKGVTSEQELYDFLENYSS